MSRLVELDGTGPHKLDASDLDSAKGDVAVCQCGLSDAFPFCDGSHRATEDEAEGACYRYVDGDGTIQRRRVARVVYEDGEAADVEEEAVDVEE